MPNTTAPHSALSPEQSLHESEGRFRALFEQAVIGVAEIDSLSGQFLRINQRYCDITGYTPAEMLARTFQDITHPDDLAADLANMERLRRGEIAEFAMEKRYRRKDGVVVWVTLSVSPRWQPGQTPSTHIAVVQDITAVKVTEAEMRKLSGAIEQTADAIIVTDTDGFIQYVNQSFERNTGYQRDEVIGRTPSVVKSGQHDKAFYRELWDTLGRGEVFRTVFINRRKDGSLFHEEKTITPLKDATGKITHFVSAGRDITERMRADKSLRENAEILERIFASTHFCVAYLDRDYNFIRVNEAYARACGYSAAHFPGKNHFQLYPHAENEAIFRRVVQNGEPYSVLAKPFEFPDHPEWGVTYWDWTLHPLKDAENNVEALLFVLLDVTDRQKAGQALHEREAQLAHAQQIAHLGNWDWDLFTGALQWSDEIFRIFGYAPQQFTPTAEQFIEAVHPDDRERVQALARQALEKGEPFSLDFRITRRDGEGRVVHEDAEVVRDKAGKAIRMRGTTQDITERQQAEEKATRLGRILDDSSNEIYVFSAESLHFVQVNQGAQRNLGYTMDELKGLTPVDIKPEFTKERFEAVITPLRRDETDRLTFTTVHQRKDGSNYPVEVQLQLMRHETPPVFVAIIQDITERRRAEEQLSYLAYYDTLTGLPNRSRLLERLQQAILDAARVNRLVAVMFLDLDRFKYVNDTLGHHIGDGLLKGVAERLKTCVRPGDIISRLGGDEFTVVLASVAHVDDVARVARKILDSFTEPFRIEGRALYTAPSIGITIYPSDENDAEGLLKNADAAMYHAKEHGRNTFQFFTAELNARAERRLRIENALRTALDNHELSLHYQPQVDTKTGRIMGMEALLRWQHAELGSVSPVEFIPIAEETGLILPIGEWVLREACRQVKTWHATKFSFSKMQVAVNVSGKQLRQKTFPDLVRQVLEDTGLEARYLDLELTESLLMEDVEETADAMHVLHDMGVSFSVDDFGTGYSSLAYLKRFPIDILKIDRTFVRDLATDVNDVAIVKTIIAMAHTLGMRVVAEGVETHQQLQFLRSQGCDGSQGYYCSMPLPAEEFSDLLVDWGRIRQGKCRRVTVRRRARKKSRATARRRVRK